ncbi:MAG TPA: UDP-N-acetylmuramoyl-L-alanyl-D-glutamate--2,6-diaminopimelate ligase [Gammaproteobacteria bacterium]|nr:UDP-N-acetylmuramoyl-L-alanyl-D-glutamate--2,6-diaminopimelate ligase [Gammaproteobacteria bacterium]
MTMLSQLIPDETLHEDVWVDGITDDSRKLSKGDLFIAMPGISHDGKQFIGAVEDRAAAILCEPPVPAGKVSAPIFAIPGLRGKSGDIASRYFGEPSKELRVFAVTGTNGKTSVANFVANAVNALGTNCGVIGTLGAGLPNELDTALTDGLTTPAALTLQSTLATLIDKGCAMVALEASSHGLSQGRLNGTQIDIAAFTNISRDHLDYHDTMDDYLQSKKQLFDWPKLKTAIFNADDSYCDAISRDVTADRILYGVVNEADVVARSIEVDDRGLSFKLESPWGTSDIHSSLLGRFNVSNLLATVCVLGALGYEFDEITRVLGQITNLPGRMHAIRETGQPLVVIDYAHTPDALNKALLALKEHVSGEIYCVFGCGGGRDKGKRAEMGEIASHAADYVIVTNDNPRFEDPQEISDDVVKGFGAGGSYEIELSREMAISNAISQAGQGDVVLLAGKGHEDYQEIQGERKPFSDFKVVEQCFGTVRLA